MSIENFIRQAGDLPSLPTIFAEISSEVSNPRSSLESIAAIISKDQSLASRLLRLANSAFYGLPSHVETIEEGLHIIGLQELRDLALATSVISSFPSLPKALVNPTEFWEHSIATGVAARLVAIDRSEPSPERFFVGGLLHDVGRLIFYLKAPEQSMKILERCTMSYELECMVEQEVFGFDHAELGGILIQRWQLPTTLQEMVRYHHQPTRSTLAFKETFFVHLGDFLSNALELGSSGERLVPMFSKEGWDRSRLEERCLIPIMQDLEKQTKELCQIFL